MKFFQIAERIEAFSKLEDIPEAGEGKIIVKFDPKTPNSLIEAKFLLFKREGNPFKGEATYFSLFLDNTEEGKPFFPVSFLVEHSGMYVRDQRTYFCEITRTPLKRETQPNKQLLGV